MSALETKRLLAMAKDPRSHVLLALSYGCGLRAGEVVRLKVGDIDSAQGIIRIVQGKGRKDRHVMLPADVLKLLRKWWKARLSFFDRDVPVQERWLFPGRKHNDHITTRQLSRLFHEAAGAAALGHDKLDTTARYTRVATGMIAGVESPLDGLAKAAAREAPKKRRKAKEMA
jgi:integrase/recombinase XerD